MSDREDTTEFAGRIVAPNGDIVEFVTLSYGDPNHTGPASDLMREQVAAIVASLEGKPLKLVDCYGDEVIPDE